MKQLRKVYNLEQITLSKANFYELALFFFPNGMAVARLIFNTQTQKYGLSYTKRYYAGNQPLAGASILLVLRIKIKSLALQGFWL
ncbi:hypothetical protein J2787_000990 [Chryseobacterium rhizosphaerae]|uniref:Uncharacterized protein n=1 Tax=Chryseobacterium rhizosphaerae TaxID=395937 RepID=A0AAE4C3G3_9FLAO|nr:hypothetical protein [Chryseobacterium rhizosphaerae]MDR6525620.1 hypothetical protein [Chryseobacterium rhizosphaerae]